MTLKHKSGVGFPFKLEFYKCPNLHASKTIIHELQALNIKEYESRGTIYDPTSKLKALIPNSFQDYVPTLEDF